MKFALALLIAVHFWDARNVHVPCHPVPVIAADAVLPKDRWGLPAVMGAIPDGCRIFISSAGAAQRTQAPIWYCADIVHETGHLAGLGHTPTGVMSPKLQWGTDIPYDCQHWRAFRRRL